MVNSLPQTLYERSHFTQLFVAQDSGCQGSRLTVGEFHYRKTGGQLLPSNVGQQIPLAERELSSPHTRPHAPRGNALFFRLRLFSPPQKRGGASSAARLQAEPGDEDFAAFVQLVVDANERLPMRILGYVLMPNHFHLVLWPHAAGDLSRWMQWLLTSHVRRYHRHYHSSGHVLAGPIQGLPTARRRTLLDRAAICRAEPAARGARAAQSRLGVVESEAYGPEPPRGPALGRTPGEVSWLDELCQRRRDRSRTGDRAQLRRPRRSLWRRQLATPDGLVTGTGGRPSPPRSSEEDEKVECLAL